jgi:hypothetical protein
MKLKQQSQDPQSDTNDMEHKFSTYIHGIKEKGYFNGVSFGSAGIYQLLLSFDLNSIPFLVLISFFQNMNKDSSKHVKNSQKNTNLPLPHLLQQHPHPNQLHNHHHNPMLLMKQETKKQKNISLKVLIFLKL